MALYGSSMPNGKSSWSFHDYYEMLKHLGTYYQLSLTFELSEMFCSADIPDLWRASYGFPIPKPQNGDAIKKPVPLHSGSYSKIFVNFFTTACLPFCSPQCLKGGNFCGPYRRIPVVTQFITP
ncbi:hypothetical protein RclHR1_22230005 [Rhizophagus clarus]|uniref:Uncharacterized protein n=1 Tax=Rhizophagus clarus TaxID=94130 RepID=A0A2Z6R7M8_9GLOM|nr:hypothetical protein RclHR1_22230005 [Rhizophagus clarus]